MIGVVKALVEGGGALLCSFAVFLIRNILVVLETDSRSRYKWDSLWFT